MFRIITLITICLLLWLASANAESHTSFNCQMVFIDTSKVAELDEYWIALSKTVKEGDHVGYESLYHPDAVIVFAGTASKRSSSIQEAMLAWKPGFSDTKAGKVSSNVEFRLSQRIHGEDSAHETGIFHYTSGNGDDGVSSYVHFEMLLVKRNGKWLGLMEYQKLAATEVEWEALK